MLDIIETTSRFIFWAIIIIKEGTLWEMLFCKENTISLKVRIAFITTLDVSFVYILRANS